MKTIDLYKMIQCIGFFIFIICYIKIGQSFLAMSCVDYRYFMLIISSKRC